MTITRQEARRRFQAKLSFEDLLELWRAIQEITGARHLTPEFHPPRKVNPVPRRLADTRRAREEIGFLAEVSLENGLRQLGEWRKHAGSLPASKGPHKIAALSPNNGQFVH